MELAKIFKYYFYSNPNGFAKAVQKHCAFDISEAEIVRLAINADDLAVTPAEKAAMFEKHYNEADWWTDETAANERR